MKRLFLALICLAGWVSPGYSQKATAKLSSASYACLPCGSDCDRPTFDAPGKCPHCGMRLVPKASIVFQNITPAELCQRVTTHPDVILLDVRTPEEFAGNAAEKFGHLKNALNIPVQELEGRLSELEQFKGREIIVYCSHNHRSPRASQLLTENGFMYIKNMTGGMSTWADSVGELAQGKALLVK